MKYLKSFNESNISPDYNVVAPIRSEIEDILIEFKYGYDIKFVHYDMRTTFPISSSGLPVGNHSENNFQLQILPKGYPDSKDIEPILIDRDILGDLRTVISFIESEIKFKYSHSYYFINHDYKRIIRDVFESEGKLVTMIQMFFTGPNDLNESSAFESYQGVNDAGLVRVYGKDDLEECDSLMLDIKDLSYDLLDLGFEVKIDYSPSTMFEHDKTPKIEVNIFGREELFNENYDGVVLPFIESIKKYVSNLGFSTGGHLSDNSFVGFTKFMTYKLLIQK